MTFSEMVDFILSHENQSLHFKGGFIEDCHKTTLIQKESIDLNLGKGKNPKQCASCQESKRIVELIYKGIKENNN
jgi:hypothetical protein